MKLIQVGGHQPRTKGTEKFAEIDDEDFERVSKYKWGLNNASSPNTTYAKTCSGSTREKMRHTHLHRFIMGLGDYKDDKRIINHIDGNGLNNQKSNLEICDTLYNSQSFRRPKSSQNVGSVAIDPSGKRIKKWKAVIVINKVKYQQRFKTEQEGKDYITNLVTNSLSNGLHLSSPLFPP
jgi:hypothetical protein